MATQPGDTVPASPPPPDLLTALHTEVGRLRFQMEQFHHALFGGPGTIGMREQHSRELQELRHQDRLLADRIDGLTFPKMLAITLTVVAVIFGGIGIEFFLIQLNQLHKLGFW